MNILIDNRENDLIDIFESDSNMIPITKLNLDIGDILIQSEKFTIIIERKTISDLDASIKDGRYKEQKFRINEYLKQNSARCIYIIEGNYNAKKFRVGRKTFINTCYHTMIRDSIFILFTKNVNETYEWIISLFNDTVKKKRRI